MDFRGGGVRGLQRVQMHHPFLENCISINGSQIFGETQKILLFSSPLDFLQEFIPIPDFYTIYDFPLSDQAPKAFILQPIVN